MKVDPSITFGCAFKFVLDPEVLPPRAYIPWKLKLAAARNSYTSCSKLMHSLIAGILIEFF